MGWLEGNVALITGAGSGWVAHSVDRFVEEGARVLAFDRAAERLEALEAAHTGSVAGVVGDVTVAGDNELAVARPSICSAGSTPSSECRDVRLRRSPHRPPIDALDRASTRSSRSMSRRACWV